MVKKLILAIMGLSFALFVSSCEDKKFLAVSKANQMKKKVFELHQEETVALERERHHSRW